MLFKVSFVVLCFVVTATLVLGQRPSFAGSRPIGFPDIPNRTTTVGLGNRFGDDTNPKLPIEANGDLELIDRLSKFPIDKQPFWFINWQALEAHRKKPQTYPQKPNVFIDSTSNQNVASTSTAQPNSNSTVENRFGSDNSSSSVVNANSNNDNTYSIGHTFEDSTEDILIRVEVTEADSVFSAKNNSGTSKSYF